MDVKTINKSSLPSQSGTDVPLRAPQRSYLWAMGLTQEKIRQPLQWEASCWNEAACCSILPTRRAPFMKTAAVTGGSEYAKQAGSARHDALTYPGSAPEKHVHANL